MNKWNFKSQLFEDGNRVATLVALEELENSFNLIIENLQEQVGDVSTQIEELKNLVSDGKSLIASAITSKGIETNQDDSFETMSNNILLIEASTSGESESGGISYLSLVNNIQLLSYIQSLVKIDTETKLLEYELDNQVDYFDTNSQLKEYIFSFNKLDTKATINNYMEWWSGLNTKIHYSKYDISKLSNIININAQLKDYILNSYNILNMSSKFIKYLLSYNKIENKSNLKTYIKTYEESFDLNMGIYTYSIIEE
jgi:hypothetical protein